MTSPTHSVTLATPESQSESQSESQEEQVQMVKHDHTYSMSSRAPPYASVVVSVKENTVSVKRNVVQGCVVGKERGAVSEKGVIGEKGVVSEEGGVVSGEKGVVSEEKGVAEDMLSQELFSEEEGVACEVGGVTCAQEKQCVLSTSVGEEGGGVVSSAHQGEVVEVVSQDSVSGADEMVCSSEVISTGMELGKIALESDSFVPGVELEQMELDLHPVGVESAVTSGGGAEGAEPLPVEELVPPTLDESKVSGVPSSSSTTPTSATPPSGSGDQTVEQIIKFLPSCELHVHKSNEVSAEQLHLLTNKLLNFIFTVNTKLETFTSK